MSNTTNKTNKELAVELTIAYINCLANNKDQDGCFCPPTKDEIIDFFNKSFDALYLKGIN